MSMSLPHGVSSSDWRLTQTYSSSSGEVRWDRFGEAGEEPVVLLHGTPFSSFIWRDLVRALTDRYQVYVWDMHGYGSSEKSAGQDISLATLGRVFADLVDYWGLVRPVVVAHDSGGAVALGAHLVHDVPYRRPALVDAVALPPWGSSFSRLAGEHATVFEQLPAKVHAALVQEYVRSASSRGLHPATVESLIEPWLGDAGQSAFYRQLVARLSDQTYTDAMQERYRQITMPVMLCWGEDDAWVPIDRGRELAERIPGAQLRGIRCAGHLVQEDNPTELTAALVTFLYGN